MNQKSSYDKLSEFEFIYYKSFINPNQIKIAEDIILELLDKYRKKANRDRFILPVGEDIKLFTSFFDDVFLILNKVK